MRTLLAGGTIQKIHTEVEYAFWYTVTFFIGSFIVGAILWILVKIHNWFSENNDITLPTTLITKDSYPSSSTNI